MDTNIIQLTSDAILQNPITVSVCGKEYKVAPPSTATLIEASRHIANLPDINIGESDNILSEVLAEAWKCDYIGDIAAILVLGKKNLVSEKKRLFGTVRRRINNQEKLSKELLENLSPEELNGLIIEIAKTLRVDFFFGILIFLKGISQIRTKNPTTASGRSSQE